MTRKNLLTFLLLTLLVVACGKSTPTATTVVTEMTPPDEASTYPSPIERVDSEIIPWYPAPGTPGAPAPGVFMTSGYEPHPDDAGLSRGEVYLNLDSSQLIIMESMPIQVIAVLSGDLPTPCHLLRVAVTAADANNRINLEVYSLVNSSDVCTTVIQPFTAPIPLGTYADGHFSVYVNGELLEEFDT